MADPDDLKELGEKYDKLDDRVRSLETYFKIGIAIGVVLGLSGGWLGKGLSDAKGEIEKLREASAAVEKAVAQAKQELADNKRLAVEDLARAQEDNLRAFRTRAEAQAPDFLRTHFDSWCKEEHEAKTYLARWLYFVFKEAQAQPPARSEHSANADWQAALANNADLVKKHLTFRDTTAIVKKDLASQ